MAHLGIWDKLPLLHVSGAGQHCSRHKLLLLGFDPLVCLCVSLPSCANLVARPFMACLPCGVYLLVLRPVDVMRAPVQRNGPGHRHALHGQHGEEGGPAGEGSQRTSLHVSVIRCSG